MNKTEIIPGFLFDMDGVLVDSSAIHFEAWQMLVQEYPQFAISYEEFRRTFGMTNKEILEICHPKGDDNAYAFLGTRKEELFRELCKTKLELLPGIEPFLQELKTRNFSRIIGSNAPIANLHFFLEYTKLGNYFDAFVSGEEVIRGKPSPHVYLEAAKRIGKESSDCIVIEDSPHGLVAGTLANCFVIALGTTTPVELLNPKNLFVKTPLDLNLNFVLEQWQRYKNS
ncbi:MAG: HAD family phosphatase [Chlamydiales bacterium]|nr:HAD family phosphatase [Chlamydiales bacterium]